MLPACRRYLQRELDRSSWVEGNIQNGFHLYSEPKLCRCFRSHTVLITWNSKNFRVSDVRDQLDFTLKDVSRVGTRGCRTKFESTLYSSRMTAQGSSLCFQHRVARTALIFSEDSGSWNGVTLQRRSQVHTEQMHLKGQPSFLKQCTSWRQTGVPSFKALGYGRKPMRRELLHSEVACNAGAADHNEKAQEAMPELTGLKKWEDALKHINVYIPHAVLFSTVLALSYPPAFTWFTTKYYAPALGFLMFAVGVNLSIEDFKHAVERPGPIALGLAGQYVLKPLLGVVFAALAVRILPLPEAVGSGLILCSCVSGAQLSNYATFLTEPKLAPLSIVMTALSTALAVVVTPLLTLLLLGKRLPIDLVGMITNITEIVVVPIASGLFLNRFVPQVTRLIRPVLPLLSLLTTCCCIGSPLAVNIHAIRSPFGLEILLPVVLFHTSAFIVGYKVTEVTFPKAADLTGLARTISFETGMQSSLLGLALADKFFPDPNVGLPSAISVVIMSLMAFGLVIYWNKHKHP